MSPAATVLIVDDHPVVRRGLAAMLGLEDWVARVVEAGSVRDGAAAGATERVDVAVVDLGLPYGDGVELVVACAGAGLPGARADDDPRRGHRPGVSRRGRGRLPAQGLAAGRCRPRRPHGARRRAGAGPGGRARRAPHHPAGPAPRPLDRLTPADLRLLALVAAGRTNPRIAAELGVAEKTVRNRVSTLLGVLGVEDRVQAALLAREKGLTSGDHASG